MYTHGAASKDYDDENFSTSDKYIAKHWKEYASEHLYETDKESMTSYLVTPGGYLKRYDADSNKVSTISSSMPRDPRIAQHSNTPTPKIANTPTHPPTPTPSKQDDSIGNKVKGFVLDFRSWVRRNIFGLD